MPKASFKVRAMSDELRAAIERRLEVRRIRALGLSDPFSEYRRVYGLSIDVEDGGVLDAIDNDNYLLAEAYLDALARHADDGTIAVHPDVIRCLLKFGGPQSQEIGPRTMWAAAKKNALDVLARYGISMDE